MGTFNLDLLINRVRKTRKCLLRCRCFAQRLQKAQFFLPKIETENLIQKSLYYFFQLVHRKQHHRNHKTKNKHRKTVITKIHLHHKLYKYSRIQHKNTANYTKTYLCTIHLIMYICDLAPVGELAPPCSTQYYEPSCFWTAQSSCMGAACSHT